MKKRRKNIKKEFGQKIICFKRSRKRVIRDEKVLAWVEIIIAFTKEP